MKIGIVSSSTRLGQHSIKVAKGLADLLSIKRGVIPILIDLSEINLPVFDAPLLNHPNPPAELVKLGECFRAADGFIFVSPEYHGSYTAALKNAVDYMSDAEFFRKPIGVVSVSTGMLGGIRGGQQMQELVLALFAYPIPQMLLVPNVDKVFAENGEVQDVRFLSRIEKWFEDYFWLAEPIIQKNKAAK